MLPMGTAYASAIGEVTRKTIDHYVERARGGVGFIVVGGTSPFGRKNLNQLVLDADWFMARSLFQSQESFLPCGDDVEWVFHRDCQLEIRLMMDMELALSQIARYRTDEIVIATMGARLLWPSYSNSDADLLLTAPMGGVPDIALGIALARPDVRVWAFNGDGCMLMYLGSLATVAEAVPSNLVLFVMDNREWGRCGHVPLPAADTLDFAGFSRDAGWRQVYDLQSPEELDAAMPRIRTEMGPVFVNLRVTTPEHNRAGTSYSQRMATRAETVRRYGKGGVANIQAHLAAMSHTREIDRDFLNNTTLRKHQGEERACSTNSGH